MAADGRTPFVTANRIQTLLTADGLETTLATFL
jgi:hypothetical protein